MYSKKVSSPKIVTGQARTEIPIPKAKIEGIKGRQQPQAALKSIRVNYMKFYIPK